MGALLDQAEKFEPRLIPWRDRFDNALVRYNIHYLVLIAILLGFALLLGTAVALYCIYKGRRFKGVWNILKTLVSFNCY